MIKRVVFRAEGNSQMGLGHVVRSAALASILSDSFECIWIGREVKNLPSPHSLARVLVIPEEISEEAEAGYLVREHLKGNEIVVLDGYRFDTAYQQRLRACGCRLVCIDDIHACHFVCDLLINHAGGLTPADYSCAPHTKFALGPAFAILREEFVLNKVSLNPGSPMERVFVCFGGADPNNLSEAVADFLLGRKEVREVVLVLGAAHRFVEQIKAWAENESRLTVKHNIGAEEMARTIAGCDFAIAPASGISYEICSLGVPLLCGMYVENQKDLYRFLIEDGLAFGLGDFNSGDYTALYAGPIPFRSIAERQREVFDGKSGIRLKRLFIDLALDVRRARSEDMALYFEWANDPEVRAQSLSTEPIPWENHESWFSGRVESQDHLFYLFSLDQEPAGQVRFDLSGDTALVNYSIARQFRGKGLGTVLLQKALASLRAERKEISYVKGLVKPGNPSSAAVFRNLGFGEKRDLEDVLEFTSNIESI